MLNDACLASNFKSFLEGNGPVLGFEGSRDTGKLNFGVAVKNSYLKIKNHDGKVWFFPSRDHSLLRTGMALYQPSTVKGKVLKAVLPFFLAMKADKLLEGCTVFMEHEDAWLEPFFGEGPFFFSFFLGTPGVHRKMTIQIAGPEGKILGYAKIANNAFTWGLLRDEAQVLGVLRDFDGAPNLLHMGKFGDFCLLLTDTRKTLRSQFPLEMGKEHFDFLVELFRRTATDSSFRESGFFRAVGYALSKSGGKLGKSREGLLESAFFLAGEALEAKKVPYSMAHRDFTPWNTYVEQRRVYAFDWEYAQSGYIPLIDFFHFDTQTDLHVRKRKAHKIHESLGERMERGRALLQKMGIENGDPWIFYLCYLLDIILLYLGREDFMPAANLNPVVAEWWHLLEEVVRKVSLRRDGSRG